MQPTEVLSAPQKLFRKRTSREWLNLGLAGLLLFYALYMLWQVAMHMMCGQIGVDYCDYWSAGKAANQFGYAAVYDRRVLGPIQQSILPGGGAGASQIDVVPFPYLPVFVLPFQLLSELTPDLGYWIWSLASTMGFFAYLRFFLRRLGVKTASIRLMLMVFASLPAFMNLLTGQLDVLLVVCIGEFMRAFLDKRPFRAGLWLGGLLLKPQVLIVLGLILLLQRSIKVLAGVASCSSLLIVASLLLNGPGAFVEMFKLWLVYGSGQANIWVEGMMNWRMLGLHLSNVAGPWIGWGFAGAGMVASLVISLYAWRKPFTPWSPSFPIGVLGILAATSIISWHSHIHTALILVPPILYLYQINVLPEKALNYWVFVPALLFAAVSFIPEALLAAGVISTDIRPFVYFVLGAGEFSASLYLFWWAVQGDRRGWYTDFMENAD